MDVAYSLRNIRYSNILDLPELEIPSASLFCITGESGAGKSTLLKLLNNLLTPDRGRISYMGRDILSLDPVALRRRAVMVPQSPFIISATVLDNLAMAFRFAQKPLPVEAQITALLARLYLPVSLDREATSLSGGEKQRLALARALLLDPEALLLDEPTGALDEETGDRVMELLASQVRESGKTVIMVTHSQNIAAKYSNYQLALHRGRAGTLPSGGWAHG